MSHRVLDLEILVSDLASNSPVLFHGKEIDFLSEVDFKYLFLLLVFDEMHPTVPCEKQEIFVPLRYKGYVLDLQIYLGHIVEFLIKSDAESLF